MTEPIGNKFISGFLKNVKMKSPVEIIPISPFMMNMYFSRCSPNGDLSTLAFKLAKGDHDAFDAFGMGMFIAGMLYYEENLKDVTVFKEVNDDVERYFLEEFERRKLKSKGQVNERNSIVG